MFKEKSSGERYQAEVPDTLDVADRAELAINAIIGAVNTKQDFEVMWNFNLVPPSVSHHSIEWFDCNPRALEALALFRSITGSDYKLDIEHAMIESVISRMGEDGLIYNAPLREDTPWRYGGSALPVLTKTDEDFTLLYANALYAITFMQRYELSNDLKMLEIARKIINSIINAAICKNDYAYFPSTANMGCDNIYYKKSGWSGVEESENELASVEGAATVFISTSLRALCRFYKLTGDEKALEMAGKFTKYILKPCFWTGNIEKWGKGSNTVWAEHGGSQQKPAAFFKGHLSCIAFTLEALIDYALIANDSYVKSFTRQGYEYFRNMGLSRIGMWGENIANGYMAAIAIKLSDSGVGDYWEDVDQYIRNSMAEDQFTDANILKKLCEERRVPSENGEFSIERLLGGLRWSGLINRDGVLDPTQNGTRIAIPYLEPFYFVWEGITRYKDGTAQVNLLLNRASPWLDVDSYLPYEGKVVIRNKIARTIAIRIPQWVKRDEIKCSNGGRSVSFSWIGNYIVLMGLNGTECVIIEFPMVETTEFYTLLGNNIDFEYSEWYKNLDSLPQYILHIKGNTCIKAEFSNRDKFATKWGVSVECETGYPVYQRERYSMNKAPMKKTTRYVSYRIAHW